MAHILVVDDDTLILGILREALEMQNHTVCEAPNGKIAEKMIFNDKFDLVVSDIMMPEMDGIELLRRVKFVNPSVRFIMITGFHRPENISVCIEKNVSRYLRKPFRIDEIQQAVEEVLQEEEIVSTREGKEHMCGWLEISVNSTEESLMRMHVYIKHYLAEKIAEEKSEKLSFSFYEMLRNAIEWGNDRDKTREVKIGCLVMSDKIVFKVQDQGNGFNVVEAFKPEADPVRRQNDRKKAGKRPGGYGIELSSKFMDDLFYNERGNCVIMSKNL